MAATQFPQRLDRQPMLRAGDRLPARSDLMSKFPTFSRRFTRGTPDECWLWQGDINQRGYGRLGPVLAHRLSYELACGAIPPGLVIDHLCRVRACVNPSHLRACTQRENWYAPGSLHYGKRTHCDRGHPFDQVNTAFYDKHRKRVCLTCQRERSRRRYALRKREAAQLSDVCRVERFDTGARIWLFCRAHDWLHRLPLGSTSVACPHEGR